MSENTNRSTAPDNEYVVGPYKLHSTEIAKLRNVYNFDEPPVISALGTGDSHIYRDGLHLHEIDIVGQTITKPTPTTSGMDYSYDQTNNDGIELTLSNPLSKGTEGVTRFTVGGPAFYAKLKFDIADVSGTDDCAFGFCKVAAHAAAIDDKVDMACLNVISGNITIETIVGSADTTSTDTTDNWANEGIHTLEVYVSALGVVTYKIDGVAPTTTAAFSLTVGLVVTPFFYLLQAADLTGIVNLQRLEVGYQ